MQPHLYCLLSDPLLVWGFAIANSVIALAYFLIPFTIYSLQRQKYVSDRWKGIYGLFSCFIFSCGLGHAAMVWTLFAGGKAYYTQFGLDAVTAAISAYTLYAIYCDRVHLKSDVHTKQQLELSLQFASDGIVTLEYIASQDDFQIQQVNPAARELTNGRFQPGRLLCEVMPDHRVPYDDQPSLLEHYKAVLLSNRSCRRTFYFPGDPSGWYENVATPFSETSIHVLFQNITEQKNLESERDRLTEEAIYKANHDELTQLKNRYALNQIIEADAAHYTGVLFIDLDHFKFINDTLGHDIGDKLLQQVAERLKAAVQPMDGEIFRIGGDEFICLLQMGDFVDHQNLANFIAATLQKTFCIDSHYVCIDCSIGVVPQAAGRLPNMIKAGDICMYQAKENRHGPRVIPWSAVESQRNIRTQKISVRLRTVSQTGDEFNLLYQPIVNMRTGQMIGVEALLRWEDSMLGRIPPNEFIRIAELTGSIYRISDWVANEAIRQQAAWNQIDPNFSVAINVSPWELAERPDFANRLLDVIDRHAVSPHSIALEITENVVINSEFKDIQAVLADLRNLRIRINIDDFGTGYSSLQRLRDFPVDEVKIDRDFMLKSPRDDKSLAICRMIATLSQQLEFTVIAEGIEQPFQQEAMLELGIQGGQGFLFSRPIPSDIITEILENGTTLPLEFVPEI